MGDGILPPNNGYPSPRMLSLAAVLSLAASCADIAPLDLAAYARVESGKQFDELAIGDNTAKRSGQGPGSYHPKSIDEAVSIAKTLISQGHDLDLGMLQLNVRNMSWLGFTVETAFDPCVSLKAAAKHLQATSRYNSGNPTSGFKSGYVRKVLAARNELNGSGSPPMLSRPASPEQPANDRLVVYQASLSGQPTAVRIEPHQWYQVGVNGRPSPIDKPKE